MARKKSLVKDVREGKVTLDTIHFVTDGLSGAEIRAKVVGKHYFGGTCFCGKHFAYNGKNPGYCPMCYGKRGRFGPKGKPLGGES